MSGDISHAGSIQINRELCGYCGSCVSVCSDLALSMADTWLIHEPEKCSGCLGLYECVSRRCDPANRGTVMRYKYDVVVVGAGPAGSTAAYITAKAGLSTLLTEKRQEIGSPVRCAETISRVRLPKFITPDPKWIANVVHGARIVAPDGNSVDLFYHSNHKEGLVLERKIFDRRLAETARLGRSPRTRQNTGRRAV